MFSNEKIEVKCPSCQKTSLYTGNQLQKGDSSKCSYCGNTIRVEEESSGAINRLETKTKQALEDIPKKITVTIRE